MKEQKLLSRPKPWTQHSVGSLGEFRKGSGIRKSEVGSHGIPCVRYGEIYTRYGTTINKFYSFISSESAFLAEPLHHGDVVFAVSGETSIDIGKCATYLGLQNAYVGSDTIILSPRSNDPLYLGYALNFGEVLKQKQKFGQGNAVVHLSLSQLMSIQILIPDIDEQKLIGSALFEVDLLLESLDKLITKKRAIKQGAMQQLLTGKTRLPGFSGERELIKIGDMGSLRKGRGIRKDEVRARGIACVRYGEIYTRFETCIRGCFSFISKELAKTSEPLVFGDIIFAVSGETSADIGKCAAFLGNFEAYVGSDTVVLRPTGHNSAYLGYALNYRTVSMQKSALGQGDAVVHLSASNLGNIQVRVPSVTEQIAIAEVLSDLDAEIDALVKQRGKTALIKIGMMQLLLTGRVRLV